MERQRKRRTDEVPPILMLRHAQCRTKRCTNFRREPATSHLAPIRKKQLLKNPEVSMKQTASHLAAVARAMELKPKLGRLARAAARPSQASSRQNERVPAPASSA